MIGSQLNHYKITRKLGTGGMGEVFAAEDTKLGREVAIKILPEDLAQNPERRERFEREAKAIAALNHPNIVTIYSVEEADGLHFITMELVEGESLADKIPGGGFRLEEFFKLSVPLADALDAAHKKGITHRDLKPSNVMVTDEGRVKVLDFGLAKLTGVESPLDPAEAATMMASGDLTEQGQILGTVAYMSPEQAEGKLVDHRSDIFSLGVVMYEMATGVAPFEGDTKISVITSIMRDTPPPVSEVNDELPQHLGRVINRSMAKKPERRYQSTSDLRTELEDLKVEIDTSQLRQSAVDIKVVESRGGFDFAKAAMAAGAVLGVVALVWIFGAWFGSGGRAVAPSVISGGRPSLAVLYFENLSGDESLDWLRTGLTDMLVTDLSQSPNVRVLGTDRLYQILSDMGRLNDSMTSSDLVDAVAREGDVENVLLGSFARAGDTIRISARLQEASTGEILSSETVEGEGEESIFSLVDELTKRIKSRFDMADEMMFGDVDTDLAEVTTNSLEAYKAYAEGVAMHEQLREDEAIPMLEKAVELDPDFAMALTKLSVAYGNINNHPMSRAYSRRAMDNLDRVNDRERFYIEGRHYSMDAETREQAIAAYQRAVDAYPDHTAARNNLAQELMEVERFEEAIGHLEDLRGRGMRFPGTYEALANAYGMTGRFDEGTRTLRQYIAENPDNAAGHRNLGGHLAWAGRFDEALEALDQAEELGSPQNQVAGIRWQIAMLSDDRETADLLSARLLEMDDPAARGFALIGRAMGELLRGDTDRAMQLLDDLAGDGDGLFAEQALNSKQDLSLDLSDWNGVLETAETTLAAAGDAVRRRANALGTRAQALAGLGDRDASQAVVDEVFAMTADIGLPPRILRRELALFQAQVAFAAGDWREVVALVGPVLERLPRREAMTGNSQRTRIHYAVGVAHYELGELEVAETNFRAALEFAGRVLDPVAYVRSVWYLGRIAEDRGDDAAAGEHYGHFLDHWRHGDIDGDRVEHAENFLESH